jgi:hypothetical protein
MKDENTKEVNDSILNFMLKQSEELQKSVKKKATNDSKANVDITYIK